LSGFVEAHIAEVRKAAGRIRPYVHRTPTLATDLDPDLRLKAECFQVTGSFKVRGAFNAVLSQMGREPRPTGFIAVSSGNHAQALALAARTVGVPALILIPEDANPAKVAATRALGAEVIQEGITFANREQRLHEVMAERGFSLVHPFDDWDVIHGQGTAAEEMLEDEPSLGLIATPVGGGGLLSGSAIAAKSRNAAIKVIGVEPVEADDAYQSWRAGSIRSLATAPATIADGVRTTSVGERTFEVMFANGLVDEIVTVTEEEIATAVRVAWTRLHIALEPTGALPLAAYLAGKLPKPDMKPAPTPATGAAPTASARAPGRIGLILTGGNANLETVAKLLGTR
jgi:threonine dehydratase